MNWQKDLTIIIYALLVLSLLLTGIFMALRVTGVIMWEWFWVISPFVFWMSGVSIMIVLAFIGIIISGIITFVTGKS